MRPATKADKRVLNSFLEWFEALTPADRERWMYMMTETVAKVRIEYGL